MLKQRSRWQLFAYPWPGRQRQAKDVFESIAKASAVMGLSAEQSGGVLLALQQMISKGTVQAEELRGQLGERLPGAFQIAAKAMGVTTAELGKMLEQGQVVADDFLPKFARALNESLGGAAEKAADRLDAAVNRFGNAWDRLKQAAGDSGVSKAMANEMSALTRDVSAVAVGWALVSMWFSVNQLVRDVADLQITVKAGNTQATTVAGEIALLRFRVENLEAAILDCIPADRLDQNSLDALTLFAINVGKAGACGSRAARLMREGRRDEACRAIATGSDGKPAWSYASGRYVQGLQNRRQFERDWCLKRAPADPLPEPEIIAIVVPEPAPAEPEPAVVAEPEPERLPWWRRFFARNAA